MVEIVFQLKQPGVSLENAQELVTKNPDLFIVNKQYGGYMAAETCKLK